jgi:hypothetical protein
MNPPATKRARNNLMGDRSESLAIHNDFGWFGNFPAFGATKTGLGVVNTDGG